MEHECWASIGHRWWWLYGKTCFR